MKKILFKLLYVISDILMRILSRINIYRVKIDENINERIKNYVAKPFYGNDTFKDEPISQEQYDLSIIVPVYNSEKYVERCINSLVNQNTHYKYQIILVNDGSTDNSLNILKKYKENYNNIYVIDQQNGGISVARNNGIRASSGKYLGFIDNDDWVTNDYVEKLLNRAFDKKADIVKCNHINYSINDNKILGIIRHEDASINGNFGLNIMDFKGYIWGGVLKRELFNKVRFPEGYWYEDILMRFTLMRICKKYEYIDENLYYYALHKDNSSKKVWKKDSLKVLDFYIILRKLLEINDSFNVKRDNILYNQLLYELGPNIWLRSRKMSKEYKHTIFNMICDLAKEYSVEGEFWNCNKYLAIAFNKQNYLLWVITSFHIICKVHIDYVK